MRKLQRLLAVLAVVCGPTLVAASAAPASPQFQMLISSGRAQQTQSSETDELIRTAYGLYQQGKFDDALASLKKATTLSPNDFRPHALSGYLYAAQRKLKNASDAFAAALRLQPRQKELYLAKVEVDTMRNAHEEALAACRKAIEVDPQYAEAYAKLGELLRFSKNQRAEAITALRTAIRIDPNLPASYEILGGILEYGNEKKEAEETFRKGMAVDPKHMVGRFELGRLLVKQGRLSEARELWDGRTSDEDRTHPQFIELLKRAEGLKHATDSLAKNPKDPEALIEMGMAVMEGDSWVVDSRQERAIVYFKRALAQKPDSARAQYAICKAYVQITDTFSKELTVLDKEMAKLRKLDPKLATEMEEYRKNYEGGLIGVPVKTDQ
jgi:tetratricopeptide (TPR) repeat protein